MAATPTPGPWKVVPDTQSNHDDLNPTTIQTLDGTRSIVSDLGMQWDADAAFIVAACNACMTVNPENPQAVADALPELVEAAETAESFLRHLTPQAQGLAGQQAESLLRAALARIEGKP